MSDYIHYVSNDAKIANLHNRSATIVVDARSSSVVGKAVVVVVDLLDSLLQNADHGVETTKAILVNGTARVRIRNRNYGIIDQETNLLGLVSGRAGHDLSGEVGCEGNELACDKGVGSLVAGGAEGRAVEQGGQVEGGKSVENNDLVGGISVDGLVQREIG